MIGARRQERATMLTAGLALRTLMLAGGLIGLTAANRPAARPPAFVYTTSCAPDRALIGIRGWQGWWMDGLQGVCVKIGATGALVSTDVVYTPLAGSSGTGGSTRSEFKCGTGQVLTGWKGTRGLYVNTVHRLICHQYSPSTRRAVTPSSERSAFPYKSGTAIGNSCSDGLQGRGFKGSSGIYLDTATLECGIIGSTTSGSSSPKTGTPVVKPPM